MTAKILFFLCVCFGAKVAFTFDGKWDEWSSWSACSKTCGIGKKSRQRDCIQPKHGGKQCQGDAEQKEDCSDKEECPIGIDGKWDEWSSWSACSKTCGIGKKSRQRDCIQPKHGGKQCQGEQPKQKEDCSDKEECPIGTAKGKFQLIWESLNRTDDQASYMPSEKIDADNLWKPKVISEFDTKTSSLDIYYKLGSYWKDETMKWNPTNFDGTNNITLNASNKVWTPEIVPLVSQSSKDLFGNRILISYTGEIGQFRILKSRVWCQQISGNSTQRMCSLKFGSWKYMSRLTITHLQLEDLKDIKTTGLQYSGWSLKDFNKTREAGTNLPIVNIFIERKPEIITTATKEATKGTEAKQGVSVTKESTIKFENKMTKLEITGENANSKILQDALFKQKQNKR